jgi:arylsulfatase A-like enzyme
MYQELLHVPLFIWHPSFSDREITAPVSLVDLMPTLIRWFQIEDVHRNWAGRNLADVRHLNERTDLLNAPLFSAGIAYGPDQTAILWKRWKRIDLTSPRVSLLYNLQHDPTESNPTNDSGTKNEMDHMMTDFQRMNSGLTPHPVKLTTEEIEQLKSVGYLNGAKKDQ